MLISPSYVTKLFENWQQGYELFYKYFLLLEMASNYHQFFTESKSYVSKQLNKKYLQTKTY